MPRGVKTCPECGKQTGPRSKTCDKCNYDFFASNNISQKPIVEKPTVVNTYDEPGRGRKQCPKCKKYVGAKVKECICKYDFSQYIPVVDRIVIDPTEQEAKNYSVGARLIGSLIIAPAGDCPVTLKDKTVEDWVGLLQTDKSDKVYAPSALRYWCRQIEPKKLPKLKKYLAEIVESGKNTIEELEREQE